MAQPLQIAGKSFTELPGSGEIIYDRQSPGVLRRLMCDWLDAPDIAEAFVGYTARLGISSVVRTPPQPHPNPKYSYLLAQRARVSGYGVPSQDGIGLISYPKAIIELEYLPPQPGSGDSENVIFVTERREASAEFLTIPRTSLFWSTNDNYATGPSTQRVGLDVQFAIRKPRMAITIDIHHWVGAEQKIQNGTFDDMAGVVNNRVIGFLYRNYGREKLLYTGATFVRQWTSRGVEAWQVSLNFVYNYHRWNRVFRGMNWMLPLGTSGRSDGYWTVCGPNGQRIHPRADFRILLPTGYRPRLPTLFVPEAPLGVTFPGVTG